MKNKKILESQIDYYRKRADEYDQWHLRQGRYDRGEDQKRRWFSELDRIKDALNKAEPFGKCLELACGTGLWTPHLAKGASSLTAIDAVAETIEINRSKTHDSSIHYKVADLFEWQPANKYDFIFFGFWLSHIPANRFERFWEMVSEALKPDGRVFFADSQKTQESTATDHSPVGDAGIVERKLNDGQIFNIVKIFYKPEQLKKKLADIGWTGKIQTTGQFFYYGKMKLKENN